MSEFSSVGRAFRPGLFAGDSRECSDTEVLRLANLERYILRARAGLPIFEDSQSPEPVGHSRLAGFFGRQ